MERLICLSSAQKTIDEQTKAHELIFPSEFFLGPALASGVSAFRH